MEALVIVALALSVAALALTAAGTASSRRAADEANEKFFQQLRDERAAASAAQVAALAATRTEMVVIVEQMAATIYSYIGGLQDSIRATQSQVVDDRAAHEVQMRDLQERFVAIATQVQQLRVYPANS